MTMRKKFSLRAGPTQVRNLIATSDHPTEMLDYLMWSGVTKSGWVVLEEFLKKELCR